MVYPEEANAHTDTTNSQQVPLMIKFNSVMRNTRFALKQQRCLEILTLDYFVDQYGTGCDCDESGLARKPLAEYQLLLNYCHVYL